MTGRRRVLRVGCALALLATAALSVWIASSWTFWARLATYPFDCEVTCVDWYDPTEPVPGDARAALPTATPAELGLHAAKLELLAQWADAHQSSALVVLRHGRIALERYWRGCGRNVPTNAFSMAKTLVGLLVGTAIERGEIDGLDAPVARWIDEWRGQPRGAITVRHLLAMQSGLHYDDDRSNPFSDMVQLHLAADVMPVVLGLAPARPPGTDFEYNNLNAQLLGVVLERATGTRYARLLSERLWRPIGARAAAIWLDRAGGNAKVYCCVFATARDWARVGELLRNQGAVAGRPVVPAQWIDEMTRPSSHNPEYGLHVWRHPGGGSSDRDDAVPGFVKIDGKSKQRVFVIESLAAVIVRTGENAKGWDDTALPRLLAEAVVD